MEPATDLTRHEQSLPDASTLAPDVTTLPWHAVPIDEALSAVSSRGGGLAAQEVTSRKQFGDAATPSFSARKIIEEITEPLREPLQLLLIVVGVLSFIWGEARDAIAIFVIIGAVAAVESISELRAKRALKALRSLSAPLANVLRDGEIVELPIGELVVGDVVAIEAGDIVPADCRVLHASGLSVDESALTGEASAAAKGPVPVALDAALAERSSMCFAGTIAVAGEARCLVVATAGATELGQLGRLVSEQREPPTPLQRAMSELARAVLILAVVASVVVPLIGYLRGQPFHDMVLAGLTLAFATIPEELPILVTVLLAIGGRRLAKRNALVRKLRAAETLGGVTVVVTDKTGTLTENRMRVAKTDGDRRRILEVAIGCQGVSTRAGTSVGDAVELALATAAASDGVTFTAEAAVTFPFDPERKRMSKVWRDADGFRICAKGAPESVLTICTMSDAERRNVAALVDGMADAGLRVLAFAERTMRDSPRTAEDAERDLIFVGIAGLEDPLRAGVPAAVATLERAGVRTIVVTGDHPRTAAAIARQAGLAGGQLLHGGAALAALDDQALAQRLENRTVVARSTPADKLRIVKLLQSRHEIVAVTGDGVNDAPALSAADVGIAMGMRGTDLAREAADVVLTDDAYPTVVAAIEGGRTLGSQLRRAVAFYLGAKVALVTSMVLPLALGFAAPFSPAQIVLLELFMDLGASVAFVSEPAAPGAMRRPPRNPSAHFLDRDELSAIFVVGLAIFAGVVTSFFVVRWHYGAQYGQAAAVATWLIAHAGVAWGTRAQPALPPTANIAFPAWALTASIAGVILAASPVGDGVGLSPLPWSSWLVIGPAVLLSVAIAFTARLFSVSDSAR